MSYPVIGYFAHSNNAKGPVVPAEDSTDISDKECLIRFDSGRAITFEQGMRSSFIVGGTGSGKTRSVVLPMISNLIGAGFGGLILDVKGNLRRQVRAIAAAQGRLADIVEFGSSANANRTNLMAGMADHEIAELMNNLAVTGLERDHNMSWAQKGARICTDIARCLQDISRIAPRTHFSRQFRPTLSKVYSIATNHALGTGLWTYYEKALKAAKNKCSCNNGEIPQYLIDAEAFYHQVASEEFHILKKSKKTRYYDEQISWNMERIIRSMKLMKYTHGILDRFSDDGKDSVPLDFDKIIYRDKKIVLIHFAIDCGEAGSIISKCIKERFYQSVIRNGLDSRDFTFMIGDEYQHIVDVKSSSRVNDMDFFSISREYRNINVIATQSIASLRSKGEQSAIASLVANCMTKIMLQCADPETIKWVNSFRDHAQYLKQLKRGACLLECFDHEGIQLSTVDRLNKAYNSLVGIYENAQDNELFIQNDNLNLPYKIGDSGLPYLIERVLNFDYSVVNHPDKDDRLYYTFEFMKNISKKNLPYWDEHFITEEYGNLRTVKSSETRHCSFR